MTAGPGIDKLWAPDGASVLAFCAGTLETREIDPLSGAAALRATVADPAWQRLAP